jgi:hypothetical protein
MERLARCRHLRLRRRRRRNSISLRRCRFRSRGSRPAYHVDTNIEGFTGQPPNQKKYNFYYSLIITTIIIKTSLFIVFSTYRRLRIYQKAVLLLELSVSNNFLL